MKTRKPQNQTSESWLEAHGQFIPGFMESLDAYINSDAPDDKCNNPLVVICGAPDYAIKKGKP